MGRKVVGSEYALIGMEGVWRKKCREDYVCRECLKGYEKGRMMEEYLLVGMERV